MGRSFSVVVILKKNEHVLCLSQLPCLKDPCVKHEDDGVGDVGEHDISLTNVVEVL